jgi:uncharacterized protein
VIIPDVNLLIYAYNEAASHHVPARAWWEGVMSRERPVGLPWAVVFGFIRLVTHSAVLLQPLRPKDAMAIVGTWLTREHTRTLEPGPRHLEIVSQLFEHTGVASNLTTDTHLAAIAIEHQAEVHSNDADFSRFPGLRWSNPLSSSRK